MSQKLDKFQRYLHQYQKLIMVNAGNFVDDQLAEDVTQETLMKMFQHIDYLEDNMVKQWLIVVSGNIAKDYLKKGGKYKAEFMDPVDLQFQMEARYESAEESFERSEKQKAARHLLWTALNLLYEKNPNWYYIMLDSYALGMTSREIANVLDTTPGNVDVMKARARAYLKKKLGKDCQDFF